MPLDLRLRDSGSRVRWDVGGDNHFFEHRIVCPSTGAVILRPFGERVCLRNDPVLGPGAIQRLFKILLCLGAFQVNSLEPID